MLVDDWGHFGWTLLGCGCERWIRRHILPGRGSLGRDVGLLMMLARLAPVRFEWATERALALICVVKVALVANTITVLMIGSVGCRLCIKVCHIEYLFV